MSNSLRRIALAQAAIQNELQDVSEQLKKQAECMSSVTPEALFSQTLKCDSEDERFDELKQAFEERLKFLVVTICKRERVGEAHKVQT